MKNNPVEEGNVEGQIDPWERASEIYSAIALFSFEDIG